MPTASSIEDVIAFCPLDIANVSYGGVEDLGTQAGLWNAGIFGAAGIFPPNKNPAPSAPPGQRGVTDWYATSLAAVAVISSDPDADIDVLSTAAIINAVLRTAYAIQSGNEVYNTVTNDQVTAVVALYNTVWA